MFVFGDFCSKIIIKNVLRLIIDVYKILKVKVILFLKWNVKKDIFYIVNLNIFKILDLKFKKLKYIEKIGYIEDL